jgi:OOP family OmpA-OmpF porin
MKLTKKVVSMTAIAAAAALMAQAAQAQQFVNPDWANHAAYIGAAIGSSRVNLNNNAINANFAPPNTVTSSSFDESDTGYKLFVGKQLNRNFAIEAGFYDLGDTGFRNTTATGTFGADLSYKGMNLDLITQLPLTERFSAYSRLGVGYTKTTTKFGGTRYTGLPVSTNDKDFHGRVGLGLEYKFTEALALRGEYERNRLNDGLRRKANVDLVSLGLVYKLGRPASAPVAYTPPPAPAPVVEAPAPAPAPMPAPTPAPAPVPTSEKVSFAAETLFDFDKAAVKPEGKAALDDLLSKLQGMNTEVMVTVGHADSVGSDKYNQKLSQRRAEAVKAYIVSKGVDGSRVYTEGKGESQPLADNKTAEGRAKNRRVTVEVVGTRTVNK